MISRSRRDSVGGGSSRICPGSPKVDAIRWEGRGVVVAEFFRDPKEPTRFGGGG